jgi:hypothetical protein
MELVRVLKPKWANRCPESGGIPERCDPHTESQPELRDQPKLGAECRVLVAALPPEIQGEEQVVNRTP